MPDRNEFYFPDLDLVPPTETLRRRLYDAAVQLAFAPSTLSQDEELPGYGPDQCSFQIVWFFGRWFAFWFDLDSQEDEELPLALRWQVVRIHADLDRPEGIHFSEV